MKNYIVSVVLLAGVITMFNSCKEDPEPPHIIVGEWEIDSYQLTDLPPNFQYYEGAVSGAIFGEQAYTIAFNQDGTYNRDIEFDGPDLDDDGTWTLEGDNLELKSEDEDVGDEQYELEEEITTDDLVISRVLTFNLLPDAVMDTLSAEWYAEHWEEIDAEYEQEVDVKVLFLFER